MDNGPSGRLKLLFIILVLSISVAHSKSVEKSEKERQRELKEAERAWMENAISKSANDEAKQQKQNVLGTLGVNYELNGTAPYLTCAFLNRTECNPDVRSDCPTTTQCYLHGDHRILACLGVFNYKGIEREDVNKTIKYLPVARNDVVWLGCFNLPGDVHESPVCVESKCRSTTKKVVPARIEEDDDIDSEAADSGGFGFCCCHTKNCNQREELELLNPHFQDAQKLLPDQPISNNREASEFPFEIVCIAMGVLLFLLVAFCVIYGAKFMMRKKKKERGVQHECIQLTDRFHSFPTTNNTSDRSTSKNRRSVTYSASSPISSTAEEEKEKLIAPLPISDLKMIDHGRFGTVFRGVYTNDDGSTRFVAVKKLKKEEKVSFDSEKEIFVELMHLNRWYPSILRYIDSAEVGDEYWLVTEYHERFSLYDLIKKNVISFASAVRITVTMLDGLQFLHDERPFFFDSFKPMIIHRDIKSKNILVKSDMTTCIGDFGLARKYDYSNLTGANGLLAQVGTKRYMSPEVLEGATEYNSAAFKQMDVYAMALVMWEVLSRTLLDENDEVGEYKSPYEEEVGLNPKIPALSNLVHTKQVRPKWRESINRHMAARGLKTIAEEMWCPLAGNRITAGCAFDRVWNLCLVQASDQTAENPNGAIDNDAVQEMVLVHPGLIKYHNDPINCPHPTEDPFNVFPYPPPPPDMPEDEPHLLEGGSSQKHPIITHFDLNKREFFDFVNENDCNRGIEPSTASTPSPEWTESFLN